MQLIILTNKQLMILDMSIRICPNNICSLLVVIFTCMGSPR